MCINTSQKPCFLDLRAFRAFWGFLRDVCGAFWSRFFVFCRFCAKVLLNRKSRRACRVRPAYPTPMHYSGSLKNCYLHARDTGGKSDETFKIIQVPQFFGVSVFNDDPKKTRRLRPQLVNSQKGQNMSTYMRRLKIQVYIYMCIYMYIWYYMTHCYS